MLNFKTELSTIKAYSLFILTILYSQCVFSQSTYSSMSPREQIKQTTELLKDCKSCETFYYARAIAKEEIEDFYGALEDYRKVNSLLGGSTIASRSIAEVHKKMENYIGAIIEYTKMINNNDLGLSGIYYDRANCKFKLKDYCGAISDYDMTIELNPNDKFAYYNRGSAKYNLNQKNSACIDWSKAGELGYSDAYDAIQRSCD
jgi:tetratricopeptide (TPR) repeat protein